MDLVDDAQARQDAFLADRIADQARTARLDAPGRELCEDCSAEIPPARRAALPSATRCVECQAWAERVSLMRQHTSRTKA